MAGEWHYQSTAFTECWISLHWLEEALRFAGDKTGQQKSSLFSKKINKGIIQWTIYFHWQEKISWLPVQHRHWLLLATGTGKYGAQIIINDITAERVELAVQNSPREGIQAVAAPRNITHKHEIDAAVEHIERTSAPLMCWWITPVSSAVILYWVPEQEWNDVIAVNQTAVFRCREAVTRHMVERKAGKVINICSIQSELGRDTITFMPHRKGGKMLTRGMCVELARHIFRSTVLRGYFKTEEWLKHWLRTKPSPHSCANGPRRTLGDPQELDWCCGFASSKASDFVNGHLLFVDGGMLVAV